MTPLARRRQKTGTALFTSAGGALHNSVKTVTQSTQLATQCANSSRDAVVLNEPRPQGS